MVDDKEIKISEIIRYIQQELTESEEQRKKSAYNRLFVTDSLEIELKCVIKEEKNTGIGGNIFKLVALSRDTKVSTDYIHTIKLSLKTVDKGDNIDLENIMEEPTDGMYPRG
jgi:hypothetical protein